MTQTVRIASAQYPITRHYDFHAWATHTEKWVSEAASQGAQLILFPEYGAMELTSLLPDSVQQDLRLQVLALDALKQEFIAVFDRLSTRYETVIVAPSLPILEAGKRLNRAYVFGGHGKTGYQDKFFMTRFENEEWGIESAPKQLSVFKTSWGKFGIQICYDVEFPVGTRLLSDHGASLILAPSCTETIRGATRVHVGARARAMEHQLFTVVAQTVGEARWSPAVDVNYGFAAAYSTPDAYLPEEGIVATKTPQEEGWLLVDLDLSLIEKVRQTGQVFNYQDQRRFDIRWTEEEMVVKTITL